MTNFSMQSSPDSTVRTPESRSTEFVPVEGGSEGTSAGTLLVTAYFVMWAVLLGFLFMTWRRQGRIEQRMAELDAELRRAPRKP